MGKRKYEDYDIWCFDFEHPAKLNPNDKDYHRASLICGKQLFGEEEIVFVELDDWFNWMRNRNKMVIYFHNLSYDGNTIIHWLKNKKEEFDKPYINRLNTIINIRWNNVDFRCSALLVRMSLKQFANEYSKLNPDFKLAKGEWDYNKTERYATIEDVPKELLEYCKQDVNIMTIMLREYWPYLSYKGDLPKLTIGAVSKQLFKDTIGWDFWNLELKRRWYPKYEKPKFAKEDPEKYEIHKMEYYDDFLRPWFSNYYGGISVGNKKYINQDLKGPIHKYDINSSYPSAMLENLPYGTPSNTPWEGENIVFVRAKVTYARMRKDQSFPCFPTDRSLESSSWLESGTMLDPCIMIFFEEELELLEKIYDLEYEIQETIYFKACKYGEKFVNKFKKMKETSTGVKREFAKYMLNNSYGKLGEKMLRVSKKVLDEITDNYYKFVNCETLDFGEDDAYLPAAMVICSRGRMKLIKAILELGDKWIYVDTDCIVCFGEAKHLDINPNLFGAWKWETEGNPITKFKWLKPKCYAYENKDGISYKVAGLKEEQKNLLQWKDFKAGFVTKVKQKSRVHGWILLIEKEYTI